MDDDITKIAIPDFVESGVQPTAVDRGTTVAPLENKADFAPDPEKPSVGIFEIISLIFGKNPMIFTPEQQAQRDAIFANINEIVAKAPVIIADAEKIVADITNAGNAIEGIIAALPDIMKLYADVIAASQK